jgi:hypothetical protein
VAFASGAAVIGTGRRPPSPITKLLAIMSESNSKGILDFIARHHWRNNAQDGKGFALIVSV